MCNEIIEKSFDGYYHKHGTGEWREDEIMKDAFISGYLSGIDYLLSLSFDELMSEFMKYRLTNGNWSSNK